MLERDLFNRVTPKTQVVSEVPAEILSDTNINLKLSCCKHNQDRVMTARAVVDNKGHSRSSLAAA